MSETGQIRQGDILLIPVNVNPPAGAVHAMEVILAEGEITGHSHRLRASTCLDWDVEGQWYVRVEGDEAGTLTHEDHDPEPARVIPPGQTYRVVRQREWDLSGQWRRVAD